MLAEDLTAVLVDLMVPFPHTYLCTHVHVHLGLPAVFTQHSGLLEKVQSALRKEAISFVSITGNMALPQR